jgi:hypothetical protein
MVGGLGGWRGNNPDHGGWGSLQADPCRLVRQVKQFASQMWRDVETGFSLLIDPCRLVRQVKEFSS